MSNKMKRMIQFFILTIISTVNLTKIPIVFVPDFGSSIIEARLNLSEAYSWCWKKTDWYRLWHSPFNNLINGMCFVNNFKLSYDKHENLMINQEGVETRLPEKIGDCDSYKNPLLDLLFSRRSCQPMTKLLMNLGYQENEIYTVNYDFRTIGDTRSMSYFFLQMDKLIADLSSRSPSVIIVSVGLGGPIVSHYLKSKQLYWRKKHIDAWYSINGPFGGSLSMVLSHLVGNDYFSPFYLNKKRLHQIFSTFPTSYFLLPSSKIFDDEVLIFSPQANVSAKNLRSYLTKFDNTKISKIFSNIKDIFVKDSPGIPMSCVHTSGSATLLNIHLQNDINSDDFIPNYVDGDGIATKQSLSACSRWETSKHVKFDYLELKNPRNIDIYSLPQLNKNLKEFLEFRQSLQT